MKTGFTVFFVTSESPPTMSQHGVNSIYIYCLHEYKQQRYNSEHDTMLREYFTANIFYTFILNQIN